MGIKASIAMAVTVTGFMCAQESKVGLGGIFSIGSTNSSSATQLFPYPSVTTTATELSWGLDLSLRFYILDPRFITLTLEPTIQRGAGRADAQQNHDSDTGGTFYIDFLKDSYYPFRFHFIDHSLSYEQQHLSSASVARRSIGFDWTFRQPRRPPVFVNYDSSRFDYEFTATPGTLTRTSSLLIATQANYGPWSYNAAFSRQSSTQAFSGLGTSTDLIRGTASRKLWSDSQLSVTGLYERLSLSNPPGTPDLNIPFLSLRTDLRTRYTKKLSTVLYHQYYRTGVETAITSPGAGPAQFEMGSTAFNDVGGQVSYRLSSSVVLEGAADAAFVSAPASTIDTAARTVSLSGSINWQRKIKFVQTRANYVQGVASASSSMGQSRRIPFETASAGLSVGDPRLVLISADGTYSTRPDLFEIGGSFTQREATGSLETRALRRFQIRGSAGINEFDYLTSRGRERFHTRTYSASVTRSIFSLMASRNATVSLRNLLQGPLAITPQQLFVTLPVDALINAPFSATDGVYTMGSLSVKPRKRFEFEARYLRERILFTNTPNDLIRQYEGYGTYRLGKFLFSAGIVYLGDSTQDVAHRLRRYYFFRISRPFRII